MSTIPEPADVPMVGKPSPRWALWSRYEIPCQNGLRYLARLRIVQTPWFGVYLHDIFEPDGDRDPHDHPWSFISMVLRGFYIEKVYDEPGDEPHRFREQTWGRWSWHRMGTKSAHRIIVASPRLKTLILVGPRRAGWGFYVDGVFEPWEPYVARRGHDS